LDAPATGRLLPPGIRPGLSIDTEAPVADDMFNVMRAAVAAHGLGVITQNDGVQGRSQGFAQNRAFV
jgi:hypothetical protein